MYSPMDMSWSVVVMVLVASLTAGELLLVEDDSVDMAVGLQLK